MADASDSKSDVGDDVWVQVASPAVTETGNLMIQVSCFGFISFLYYSLTLFSFIPLSSIPPEYIYPASSPAVSR